MCAKSGEDYRSRLTGILIEFIYQQEVAADMALARTGPLALERMISPFWSEWTIVGYQHQHHLFEPDHIVTSGT